MKKSFLLLITIPMLIFTSCCDKDNSDEPQPAKNHVRGKVVDTKGNPIPEATIAVNNTQFFNHNILGKTDANGNYKLELTPGSWYVRATFDIKYDNQTYTFDLHPETQGAFSGSEGAIRNFKWQLTGEKPTEFGGGGFYGGGVEIYGYEFFFDTDNVELTLEPIDVLVDGSVGKKIINNPEGNVLNDIPIGKYKITARYVQDNSPMLIRLRNKGQEFQSSVTANFEPSFPGAKGSYKIVVEVTPQ